MRPPVAWKPRVLEPLVFTAVTVKVAEPPCTTELGFWLELSTVTVPTAADTKLTVASTSTRLVTNAATRRNVREPPRLDNKVLLPRRLDNKCAATS